MPPVRLARLLPPLLALVPLACGGGSSAPPEPAAAASAPSGVATASLVTEAADATAAARSSRVSIEAVFAAPGRDEEGFSAKGAFDYERRAGAMTIEASQPGNAGSGRSRVVFSDRVVYYEVAPGVLPDGRTWLRLDLRALGELSAFDLEQLAQGSQSDPGQYLDWLAATGSEVEKVGREDVRGVATTRYRTSVVLDRVVEQAPEDVRAGVKSFVERVQMQTGREELPTDVWIDQDGLVRRLEQEYPVQAGGVGVETEATVTVELYDFGVAVDASPPSEEEALDIASLLGQG